MLVAPTLIKNNTIKQIAYYNKNAKKSATS